MKKITRASPSSSKFHSIATSYFIFQPEAHRRIHTHIAHTVQNDAKKVYNCKNSSERGGARAMEKSSKQQIVINDIIITNLIRYKMCSPLTWYAIHIPTYTYLYMLYCIKLIILNYKLGFVRICARACARGDFLSLSAISGFDEIFAVRHYSSAASSRIGGSWTLQ